MTNHLRDDFDALEFFAVVDADGEVDHLREDDHVTAVGFDYDVLPLLDLSSCVSQFHEEFLLSGGETTFEGPTSPCGEEFDERVHVHLD